MSHQRYQISTFLLILILIPPTAFGYGSVGPIAAAFGENGFFCAIDASGKQEIICWDRQNKSTTTSSTLTSFVSLPPMASLSGGQGFLCGLISNSSKPYCWNSSNPGQNLVPEPHRRVSYSDIAPGRDHVCGVRGEYYSKTETKTGTVDCWVINGSSVPVFSIKKGVEFRGIVSGDGFACGVGKDGAVVCWGPESETLEVSGSFEGLVSGRRSICGIETGKNGVKCFGDSKDFGVPPVGIPFVGLSAGLQHYCGIRQDDHSIECWGEIDSASAVPKGSMFMAIASSDFITCGVREVDLVLDCWGIHGLSPPDYSPPLQLSSPGVCSPGPCAAGQFAFNASALNEPGLTSLCSWNGLDLCLPCGTSCPDGFFPSSVCSANANRVCTACSLCSNSTCSRICNITRSSSNKDKQTITKKFVIVFAGLVSSSLIIFVICLFISTVFKMKKPDNTTRTSCFSCAGKQVVEADPDPNSQPSLSLATSQIFRLSELKDATHGFKEYNELGRGNFGFVYKAALADGTTVAVKRANAATIIHTNTKEFETEIEILSNIRHPNIVNLLGYSAEMGERLLVYEYIPNGTLSDHLHGELPPLDWNQRLRIALQAAKGLEYLHSQANPIVHRNVKSSNILLDSEWVARVSDFGVLSSKDSGNRGVESDVFGFGIVLLEILSGRKSWDSDCDPPGIVEWAVPAIRRGKVAAIVDRSSGIPRSLEAVTKVAEVAEMAVRESPSDRPSMNQVVGMLEQIVKIGVTM